MRKLLFLLLLLSLTTVAATAQQASAKVQADADKMLQRMEEKLGLSAAQVKQLKPVCLDVATKMDEVAGLKQRDKKAWQEGRRTLVTYTNERILPLLNEAQKQQYKLLQAK